MNTPRGAQPRFERGREVIEPGPVRGLLAEVLDCALARTTRPQYGTALQDGFAGRKVFSGGGRVMTPPARRRHARPLIACASRSKRFACASIAWAACSVQRLSMASTAARAQSSPVVGVWFASMPASLFFFTREAHPKASEILGSPRNAS